MRKAMILGLMLLFVALSFNAYACLIPIYGGMATDMQRGCSEPYEQAADQFCDGFKHLGVQTSPTSEPQNFPIGSAAVVDILPPFLPAFGDELRWRHPPREAPPLPGPSSSMIVLRI